MCNLIDFILLLFFFPGFLFIFVFRDAAEAAGFRVLRLIHEPAAGLLAYNIGQESSSGRRYKQQTTLSCHQPFILIEILRSTIQDLWEMQLGSHILYI